MSIITLTEAQKIDPSVDLLRLGALEAMVQARTANRFHLGHGHGPVELSFSSKLGDLTARAAGLPILRDGDTIELVECGYSSGLYTVTGDPENGAVALTGGMAREVGSFPAGRLCLVQYPADVVEGVRGLIAYDAERAAAKAATPADIKSKTIGRASETYRDDEMVRTPAGVYPAALLAFLAPHRRLSWGS